MVRYSLEKNILIILSVIYIIFAKNIVTIYPTDNSIISSPLCTLSVTTKIPADSVAFSISYYNSRGIKMKKSIGTVNNSPFKILFNSKDIGNQYFYGADIIAKIFRVDDTVQIVNSSRVFFVPNLVDSKTYPLYPQNYAKQNPIDTTTNLSIGRDSSNIIVNFSLNRRGNSSIKEKSITVLLDPLNKKLPYPSDNTIILSIPFSGTEKLITTSTTVENGKEKIVRKGTSITLNSDINIDDKCVVGKIKIPDFLLGGSIPDTIGINVMLPNLEADGFYSLVDSKEEFINYTPMLFPNFTKSAQPLVETKAPILNGLSTFFIGLILSIIIILINKKRHITPIKSYDNSSELLDFIHKNLSNKELSLEFISKYLNRNSREINKQLKKEIGKPVEEYIKWARIEIVKEKLILSNESEVEISKECGFKDIAEMETAFLHQIGIAPYQFREKNKNNDQ